MKAPLLVIVGETASGKSSLAMKLATKLNGEIICADSWTVRKGVNIGTDKPSLADQKKVPHHLLDIVEPNQDFTAAVFKQLAEAAIEDIYSRDKLPIMVGGSGLYVDSVLYNYGFLEMGDRGDRQKLNNMSLDELIDVIKTKDLSLDGIDERNKRRLIRLIETNGKRPAKAGLRENTIVVGIKKDPSYLSESIEKRVDQMIANGLEKEVRMLQEQYGWQCEALKGVGYKQWRGYVEGHQSLQETRSQIISATNNLAKKQRTWFKRNVDINWLAQPVILSSVVDLVTAKLSI